jgi:hypothetical protein
MLASGIAHYELLASKIAVLLGKYSVNQETGTALELAFQVSPKPKPVAIQSAVRVTVRFRIGTARPRHGTAATPTLPTLTTLLASTHTPGTYVCICIRCTRTCAVSRFRFLLSLSTNS